MRNVLAITVALMMAAIIIMPALGYTNQAAGNQSYSIKSGEKLAYSFTTDVPAHNLTAETVSYPYSFQSSGVQSTRVAGSFKEGQVQPYTVKVESAENAVALGGKTEEEAALLGSMNKQEAKPAAEEAVAEQPAAEEIVAPEVAAPAFSIEGVVFNDTNANSTMDAGEAGLAGWTVNLEQAGAIVNTTTTAADGRFAFAGLAAGEYIVSEVLAEGWAAVAPADGRLAVTITDASRTDLLFANQLLPASPAPAVVENNTTAVDINATI